MAEPEPIALVTGANAGIGLFTALGLAGAGFRVIMVGRDAGRIEQARRIVAQRAAAGAAEAALADFASLEAVRQLADTVLARHSRLDVLVNNAGLISRTYQLSEDGYELTVAVNHLAPFLLTNLLLDRLRSSAPSRIVTVASEAHRGARIVPSDMVGRHDWSPLKAYRRSKLCNILFTRAGPEARRQRCGRGLSAPGVVDTAFSDSAGRCTRLGWRIVKPFLISAEQDAAVSLYLATIADPRPFHGAYVVKKRITWPAATALDDELAEMLWNESARLVGLVSD